MDRTLLSLFKAVTEGNSASLSQLLEANESLRQELKSDENENTLLHIAANSNNVRVVEVILKNQPTDILKSKNYRQDTALHIAARHNNAEVVKFLLRWVKETDKGEMAKVQNIEGNIALHEAVLGRHRQVIEVLMVERDQKELIELIFFKNKRDESPLYLAAYTGLHDVLEKMLNVAPKDDGLEGRTRDLPYGGPDGMTPLHAATAMKRKPCINILLNKVKELISRGDKEGRNPLHYAASFGHSEEARCILIKDTLTAHKKDNHGLYPIHMAANKGHVDIIKAMLKYCPEIIEALNEEHQNVAHLAAKNGRANLVSYMLHNQKSKFDKLLNAKDINGNTPLHLASMSSHPKVVSILMQRNIDKTILNKDRLTALDIAEKEKMKEFSLPKVLSFTALTINGAPSGLRSPNIEKNASKDDPRIEDSHHPKTEDNKDKVKKDKVKERFDTLGVVAALITSATFAAGFSVPRAYHNNPNNNNNDEDGDVRYKRLLSEPAFNVFVICNTMAFFLSINAVVNNIWARFGDVRSMILAVKLSLPLLGTALISVATAFAAGLYSVAHKLQWFAILLLVLGPIFFTYYILLILVLFNILSLSKYPGLRYISKLGFCVLIIAFDIFFPTQTAD